MRTTYALIISLICLTYAGDQSGFLRINNFLNSFEYPHYSQSDRDVILDFSYDAHRYDNNSEDEFYDNRTDIDRTFNRNADGNIGLDWRSTGSSPLRRIDTQLLIKICGTLAESSSIYNNDILGVTDTNAWRNKEFWGTASYGLQYERHLGLANRNNWPFWRIDGTINVSGNYSQAKQHYYSNREGINLNSSNYTAQYFDGTLSLRPSIGFGKKKPIQPVYQAYLIEHKLKKSGIIKGNLSDSTMHKIAEFSASVKAYQFKNDKFTKYFMKDLEKILCADSNLEDTLLDAFALFRLHEVFETELPLFYSGPSIALTFPAIMLGANWYSGYRSSFKAYNESIGGFDFNWEHPNLELGWVFPLFYSFFTGTKITIPLRLGDDEFYGWANGEANIYYMLFDNIFLDCGIERNQSIVSERNTTNIHLTTTFYIEDFLSVTLKVQKLISKDVYETVDRKYVNENIKFGIDYDF